MQENIHRVWIMKILNMTKNNKKMGLGKDEGTCWTRWTVGARKTQTPLPGLEMRCLNSYMSSTAMCVFPHPVSKYTMMFSSTALLQSSNWYLQNPKSPTNPINELHQTKKKMMMKTDDLYKKYKTFERFSLDLWSGSDMTEQPS